MIAQHPYGSQSLIIAFILWIQCIIAGNFTYPTETEYRFRDGDQVNVTWDVVTPRLNLWELCWKNLWILQLNVSNKHSYVWTATRNMYREAGCHFLLQPLNSQGKPDGPNVTSLDFGVPKRYHDDPPPVSHNFASTSSHVSTVVVTASNPATSTPSATTTSSTTSSAESSSGGMPTATKIGIGLGVPLGAIVLGAGLGTLFLFRRGKKAKLNSPEVSPILPFDSSTPLPGGFVENNNTKDIRSSHTRTISELSSENYGTQDTGRADEPREVNELMGVPRSELG
ncbi:hypothetical protein BDV25DRAFT_138603 [Aspergillus avenaceus]|uniref:Mid2 domain-containing protein n=1 Tax=Aspergillus avenaceus TaxID=36643 RepID=A0A5N6TZB2_ASPAV|nr:hypothetical protein BDV25DRAFT_138603 [Aspergillus avenaceus]